MSVEFRQRAPAEYASILWRRKWLIILPTIALSLAVAYAVRKLPNVYESNTLLAVRPATISAASIGRLSDTDLTFRINNITQDVLSRTSLEPLIERFGLYRAERERGEPVEFLVERMRTRDVQIRLNTSRNDVTNGFNLSFRASDPRQAQNVTQALGRKYVDAQVRDAKNESTITKEFFNTKLEDAKRKLDEIDQRRVMVMTQNMENLPSQVQALVERLTGLYEQKKAYLSDIGRLRESYTAQSNLLSATSRQRDQQITNTLEDLGDPKASSGYVQLASRKSQLEAEKQLLLNEYKPKHPDVIAKQTQIDAVQKEMSELLDYQNKKAELRRKQFNESVDVGATQYKNTLQSIDNEIKRGQKQMELIDVQLSELESRINKVPGAEVELGKIDREYSTTKGIYEDMLRQRENASLRADVNANSQGESIAVIDAANLPVKPVAPNRPLLMALGVGVGLGLGLLFAVAFEIPRLLTVQTKQDAEHYTGLPVLVLLPEMLTMREVQRLKMRRVALAVAGVVITVISIPALALALRFSRILETFAMRG
ncbi:MAG: hypothetical protein H0W76_17420 [Pyrinomonadaceae bacterium]|nr:hypothetical protein [Pyrinomonadaceae bacterium]